MDTILELQVKVIYGTERIYPMNETAKKLASLLQRKTLTKDDVNKLKEIGFSVKWVPIAAAL